ncbi:MAG: electron transport complex subunit RsxG [Candidatus Endonucleobacter bathymodioli]|uniref:Ion-translocating oxidoreductase complex subunit G n=1 Tax=Candidatus Endonucleibacter bathymodioli TaxID=539814 RepID=A0AA90SNE9_9GAMM|nr:electron transport complex subunit RsxG [Candidatus Endonucleobacter bathymodioli]
MNSETGNNPQIPMNPIIKSTIRNSLTLGLFSVLTVGLISLTYILTRDRISEQVRSYEAKVLIEILPDTTYDNILLDSMITLQPSRLLSTSGEKKAFVALKQNQPIAVILPAVAPNGYNGRIELLVGINRDGTLAGVRVVTHKETPGLGDKIDTKITNWVLDFDGKSLENIEAHGWAVQKDGGQFDQFTGATITPRAVVAAVYKALKYFEVHQKELLDKDLMTQNWIQDSKHDQ